MTYRSSFIKRGYLKLQYAFKENEFFYASVEYIQSIQENGNEFSENDFYSTEYMEMVFREGNRPFKADYDQWSSSRNDRILKTISEIIRIVSNIGDEEQYGQ